MTLSVQFLTLMAMVGTGLGMAWFYDLYTWMRAKFQLHGFLTFLFDVLYWLLFAVVTLLILYRVNEGKLRFTLFFALILGGLIYFRYFSQPFMHAWEWLVQVVLRLCRFIARLISILIITPLKWLIEFIFTIVMGIGTGLWKVLTTIYRWLRKPFVVFFRWIYQLTLALIQKVGKMITRLLKRKPKDE